MTSMPRLHKILFVVLMAVAALAATAQDALASHYRYASITWTPTSDPRVIKVRFEGAFRWSYPWFSNGSVPGVGSQVDAGALSVVNFTTLAGQGVTVTNINGTSQGQSSTSAPELFIKLTSINATQDWFFGSYEATWTFPATVALPSDYRIEFNSCCRIQSLLGGNDSPSTGTGQYSLITRSKVTLRAAVNGPPSAATLPIYQIVRGQLNQFQIPASDAEGDGITFSIPTPSLTESGLNVSTPPGLTLSAAGLVSWNPAATLPLGLYAMQARMTDNTTGAFSTIDLTFNVASAVGQPPTVKLNGNATPLTISTLANQPVAFTVAASDPENTPVILFVTGLPAGATLAPQLPMTAVNPSTTFTWTPTLAQAGTYVVNFSGTDGDGQQDVNSVTINVANATLSVPTTTVLDASPASSIYGSPVTLTATVTNTSATNGGAPVGTVQFFVGGVLAGTSSLASTGAKTAEATLTVPLPPAGTSNVTATYAGATAGGVLYSTSTASQVSFDVSSAASTTTVSSSLNPSQPGNAVTFTVTVAPPAGHPAKPTGSVVLKDGTATLATLTLVNGSATFATAALASGAHSITAAYAGDAGFSPGVSAPLSQRVGLAPTTVSAAATANPSFYGNTIPVAVQVLTSDTHVAAPGTVVLKNGAGTVLYGPNTLDGNGQTLFSTAGWAAGTPVLTVEYSPAAGFSASSAPVSFMVLPDRTVVEVSTSPAPSGFGQPVTLSAHLRNLDTGLVPTGSIKFDVDGVATVVPLSGFDATLIKTGLVAGTRVVTASYQPADGNFAASSASVNHQVNKARTSTTLASSVNPSLPGQSVTFTATVGTSSGVTGHWPLNDAAGSTRALDAVATNDGVCGLTVNIGSNQTRFANCPQFGVPGVKGTAAHFNGATQFLAIQQQYGGTFSASAWIRTTQVGAGSDNSPAYEGTGILWSDWGGCSADYLPMALTHNRLAFFTGGAGCAGDANLTSTVAVNTGQWVHVVVTRDSVTGAKQMFINGVLNASGVGPTGQLGTNPIIGIGGNALDNRYFNGDIDDVQFFNHVLTPAEVTTLYVGAPEGTVSFTDSATGLTYQTQLVGGVATYTPAIDNPPSLQVLAPGIHSLIAVYQGNDNYGGSQAALDQLVQKKRATITVNGFSGTYDGNPHHATGSATGDGGLDLSGLLDLGASFTDAPGGAANWTFAGNETYEAASGSVAIDIAKAPSSTVVTFDDAGPWRYRGTAYTASAKVEGVGLSGVTVPVSYTGDCTNVSVPLGCTATASFSDNNHVASTGDASITIEQAAATIAVSGYSGVYDAAAHGATGSATGVQGESLDALLDLGATFTNVAGGTAHWVFAGNVNYLRAEGDVAIAITPKTAFVTANSRPKTYGDVATFAGSEFTTSEFIGGDSVASVTLTSTGAAAGANVGNHAIVAANAAGAGLGNYAIRYVDGVLTVNPAPLTVTVSNASRIYHQPNPVFGGTVAGIKNNDPITAAYSTAANFASVVGTYDIDATLNDPSTRLGNYTVSIQKGTLTINRAPVVLTFTSGLNTSGAGTSAISVQLVEQIGALAVAGQPVTVTAGAASGVATTGANGQGTATLTLSNGQYTVNASFAGDANYLPAATAASQQLFVYQPTQFVVWGGNASGIQLGAQYNFWGAQWSKQVTGGSYSGNASFKGYAEAVSGSQWTAGGGNSSNPPASVAQYIGVLVTTQASKSGSTTTGNVSRVVILRVDNPQGYQPNPGHSATGVMVANAQ